MGQKHIQTLSIRVGYPWVSMSMDKIAILRRRQVALEGLAGAGIRGEEVGGGWHMIGGTEI